MNDTDLARELEMAYAYPFTNDLVRRWLSVARKARQLCGPTHQQLAVIEAAKLHADQKPGGIRYYEMVGGTMKCACSVCDAVRALRDSETKSPLYYVADASGFRWFVMDRSSGLMECLCEDRSAANKLCDLLNRADRRDAEATGQARGEA